MSTLAKELLEYAKAYCELTHKSRATVASTVMDDGKFFDRIENGGGFTDRTYDKVHEWFKSKLPEETYNRIKSENTHNKS